MKKSIKKQLEALNMKKAHIADAIGMNRNYFSKIWNGHTPLSERFSERLGKLIADPSYQFGKRKRAVLKKAIKDIKPIEPLELNMAWKDAGDKTYTEALQEMGAVREETPPPHEENSSTNAYADSLLSDLALAQKAIGALYLENIKLQNGSAKN